MKKRSSVFLVINYVLIFLSSHITGEAIENDEKKCYLKCQEYMLEGNVEEALELIKKALAVNPEDEMCIYLKENILGIKEIKEEYNNQIRRGKSLISEGEKLLGSDTEKLKSQGELLKYLGNKLLREAPQKFADELKKRYNIYIDTANKSYSEEQYEDATNNYLLASLLNCSVNDAAEIREILKQDRQFEEKGDACFKEKQYSKAIEQYNEAIKLNPDFKHIEGKILYMERIIKKADELVMAGDDYAGAYSYDKAIERYKEALEITPGDEKIKIKIDQIKQSLRNYESLEEAGDKYVEEKKYDMALEAYIQLLQDSSKLVNIKGKISRIEGKIALIKEIIKKIDDLVLAGDEYWWKNNFVEALKKYREALELSPENGKIIVKINKIEQATKKYEEIADKYFNEKKYDMALEVYNYLLQSNPALTHIKEKIAKTEDEIRKEKKKDLK